MGEPPEATPGTDLSEAERKRQDRDERIAMYRTGMSFSYIGIEFGLALLLGWFIGSRLDAWLGTDPWMLILWIGFGFAAAVRDLVRLVRKAQREMEEGEDEAHVLLDEHKEEW